MRVLPERKQDEAPIRRVHLDAFRRPAGPDDEPPEAALVDELRASDAWIPGLSLVAVIESEVVGHVCTTRGQVDEEPALALGPIGVLVAHQGRGIGTALVRQTLRLSESLGEPLIALLGSDTYYGRFGFEPSTRHGIEPPDPNWGHHFQVKILDRKRGSITGKFRYPPPFDAL
jgi:putative acetyltransferase